VVERQASGIRPKAAGSGILGVSVRGDCGGLRLSSRGRFSLPGTDLRQLQDQPESLVDGLGRGKRLRHVRRQQDKVRSLLEPLGVPALHSGLEKSAEIILRPEIVHEGVKYWLGTYDDEAAAARAYDRKAVEIQGPYARLNFPEEWGRAA
jgi:hypothetical protein